MFPGRYSSYQDEINHIVYDRVINQIPLEPEINCNHNMWDSYAIYD